MRAVNLWNLIIFALILLQFGIGNRYGWFVICIMHSFLIVECFMGD